MSRLLPLGLVLAALSGLGYVAATEIFADNLTRASDALPLYLAAAAAAEGLDPTEAASLARVYDARGLTVGAATFSTLYPATAGALLQPFARLDWETFTVVWRSLLLLGVVLQGVGAGLLASRHRLSWGAAVVAMLVWHPVTAECVRLGQVNLLLGTLIVLALAAVRRWEPLTGALLALGALVKLVPGVVLLPLLGLRRAKAALALALTGLGGLTLALTVTPLDRLIEAVRGTLAFQAGIDPDWLVGRSLAPPWMRWLGHVRHDALPWISLGLAGLVPLLRPTLPVAMASAAVLVAWLGADAAGFHVLYIPLAWPALVVLSVGRLPWFLSLSAGYYALALSDWPGEEPAMVLFGLLLWGASVLRLLQEAALTAPHRWEQDPELKQGAAALAGVLVGVVIAGAGPGDGPVAAPLPEGQTTPEGPGYIHPNDRVPGSIRALGAGLDRPASTIAKPGTIRDLQLYLSRAPTLWTALAERYPARASRMRARANAAPAGLLRELSGREVGDYLRAEQAELDALAAEGLVLGELPTMLTKALASGLADPEIEVPPVP